MKSKGAIIISRHNCILVVLLSLLLCSVCFAADIDVTMSVDTVNPIAETDDIFVCGTLDWWPSTKCDFNGCPWGNSGVLDLDLSNPILVNAVKAFDGVRIRIGGLLQNQVVYKVGTFDHGINCSGFKPQPDGMFGFSTGCLDMDRWDSLNKFFNETGAVITFGLNALISGKKNLSTSNDTLMVYEFMKYTADKQYNIDSYELGISTGTGLNGSIVDPIQYVNDMMILKYIRFLVYHNDDSSRTPPRPDLVGPGGAFEYQWFKAFQYRWFNASGRVAIDSFFHIGQAIEIRPWVSDSSGAASNGSQEISQEISNSFANMFRYMNQLGLASRFNHIIFCRQTLVGGYNGLLNSTTFIPNPDYYGALLFNRLMGKKVLFVTHNDSSTNLLAYAHCSKQNAGISILIINMSATTRFNVRLKWNFDAKSRDEYHLTPEDGNILSKTVLLNDMPLNLTNTLDIPELIARSVDPTTPIQVAPNSIVFVAVAVAFADFNARACSRIQ